jgi:TRAP-type mannitol/chloroaromatic compound transport system substrate-binding protein
MKAKRIWLAVSLLVFCGLLVMPTMALPQTPKPEVIKWRGQTCFGSTGAPYGPFRAGQVGSGAHAFMWADWLKKASNGRLIVEWAEPGTIFPITDSDIAVGKNVVQIACTFASYYGGRIPEADIETGGVFQWENDEQLFEWLHKYGGYQALQKIYAKHNLKWIPYHTNAIVGIGTNFPAPDSKAIKGKKIRAVGMWADYIKMLGGNPVPLPWGDIYLGMKMGTIDGWVAGSAAMEELKLKENTTGYVYPPKIASANDNFIINMAAFNALPKDLQALLERDTPYVTYALSSNWLNQCTWVLKNAEQHYGLKVYAWPSEEVKIITQKVVDEIYPRIAAKSQGCAELIEIVKKQMRDYGRIK